MKLAFKSLATVTVEIPLETSSRMARRIRFDLDSVMDHTLEIGAGKILADRAWLRNGAISAMIVAAVFALVYGLAVVFGKLGGDAGPGGPFRNALAVAAVISFILLTSVLSVRGALAHRKREFVESVRGKGPWKIVDDSGWERFRKYAALANESDRARHAVPGRPGPV